MDSTTIAPEDTTARNVAVWSLFILIVGALTIFVLVTRDAEHSNLRMRETQACQMEAVRGGASLAMAEQLCGKV